MASRARAILVSSLSIGVALASSLVSARAFADDNACIRSYEQTQTLRRAGKLHEARAEAAKCASDTCPAVLAKDCTKWLSEIDQSIPTVVFDVRSATGEELTNVRVTAEGNVVAETLDGKSITLDIGPHSFRFESTDGKGLPAEHKTVIHEGDKNRKISVTLAAPQAVRPTPEVKAERPVPLTTWVFGGVALASLGVGTVFALDGSSKEGDLERCRPSCPGGAVNDASTSFAVADILLTAGVVSAVAAAVIYFTRPTVAAPATAASVTRGRPGLPLALEF